MIKTTLSRVRVAAFCLALVTGCGSTEAPPGSTITVSPDVKDWAISAVLCDYSAMHDTWFVIAVKSPSGTPVNYVDIWVTLDLAPGTFSSPYTPMFLYDTADDGVTYNVLITNFPYQTKTGSYGTKMLRVEYDLSCTYAGDLEVRSGSAFGSAHIDVELAS